MPGDSYRERTPISLAHWCFSPKAFPLLAHNPIQTCASPFRSMSRALSPAVQQAAAEDRFVSVSRLSYQGVPNPSPSRPVHSALDEKAALLESRRHAPKFTATTNYEVSFPPGQQSPGRSRNCKPPARVTAPKKFEETSTSRSEFTPPSVDVLKQTSKRITHADIEASRGPASSPTTFSANSESRRSYKFDNSAMVRPVRGTQHHREARAPIPFTAVSTHRAEFTAPSAARRSSGPAV